MIAFFLYLSLFFFLIGLCLLLTGLIISNYNYNIPKSKVNLGNYCFLIPARYESNVIEKLLISLENQTLKIRPRNVYVIIESMNDPTSKIVNQHHMNIFIRKYLTKQTKGYALDEAIREISLKDNYDAYFIFDADNILDKNYLSEMTKCLDDGYDIALGYRNTINGNASTIAACSSLTFSMINTIGNRFKMRNHNTMTISGTGYYISGTIINQWHAFPFKSLTEDYELTLYATLHGLSTTYNPKAIYYDEQPTNLKTTITQRSRWVKGYFQTRHNYLPKILHNISPQDPNLGSKISTLIGVKPYILIILSIIIYLITTCIKLIINNQIIHIIPLILITLLLVYFILFIFTGIMLYTERNHLKLDTSHRLKALFYNPIFLLTYIHCAMIAIFNRQLSWQKIEHHG